MKILEVMLDTLKSENRKNNFGVDQSKLAMMGFSESNDGHIFEQLKMMWAENGDQISK